MKFSRINFLFFLLIFGFNLKAQTRLDADLLHNQPIVIHTMVALADNKNQLIVPVPDFLGNGQNPQSNLYWGAMYGVKNFLMSKAGWKLIQSIDAQDDRILEKILLKKSFKLEDKMTEVYLLAEAWDGRFISETVTQFMKYNAGHDVIDIKTNDQLLQAGGKAHLMVYIGHNVLMDFADLKASLFENSKQSGINPENDAIVLACKSQPYFQSLLTEVEARPILLTTGLMAPEAYTLNAAIEQWINGADVNQIRKAAAASYNKYQKTGKNAAQRLFGAR